MYRHWLLSPLWGSPRGRPLDPRLTPWATILRRYAAGTFGIGLGTVLLITHHSRVAHTLFPHVCACWLGTQTVAQSRAWSALLCGS
jgi:hypothetical protein